MKRHLPNFLTCCNLLCGVLGVIYVLDDHTWSAGLSETIASRFHPAYFVWAACVFDFFDGFAARALKATSSIGRELDSLADMISFGLLPAVFMFKLIAQQLAVSGETGAGYLPYTALVIAVFSAIRLAIFNIDQTQRDSFKGLPTPASALFITGLPFIPFSLNPYLLAGLAIVCSFLLVSRIDLFALKFKNLTWSDNKVRFTFLLLSVLSMMIFKSAALPLIIILYILLSLGYKAAAR